MNTLVAPATPGAAAATRRRPAGLSWWRLASALLAIAGAALAWRGGADGVGGAMLAMVGTALAVAGLGRRSTTAPPAVHTAPAGNDARQGTEVMITSVVPVWARQIELARDAAAAGLSGIVQTFVELSGQLHEVAEGLQASTLGAQPCAVDGAVRSRSAAIDALASASERAFAQRAALQAQLESCADGIGQLEQAAKQAREVARHTRLVAFNASIEANRGQHQRDGGAQAVAEEMRALAARMAASGEAVEQVAARLGQAIGEARREGELGAADAQAIRLEVELRAREALAALLSELGGTLGASAEMREQGVQIARLVDEALVALQFDDRLGQMLSVLARDMTGFVRWTAEHPKASQSDAARWLVALEAAYTTEEQRSRHHGNVHVDRGGGVEYF